MRPEKLENHAFLVLVALTTVTFLWLVKGFLMTIFWAAVFAVLFRPVFLRCLQLVRGRRSVAALLTTLSAVLVILVPVVLMAGAVTSQAQRVYRRIASGEMDLHAPIDFIERQIPALTTFLAQYGIDINSVRASFENAAVAASHFVATLALSLGQDLLMFSVLFVLMLYLLFFFVRDWERILDGVVRALPLGDDRARRLFAKFAQVARATMKGTFAVAVVQGVLGGLLFVILGIEAAIFWGVMMAILSLLPAVGPILIWGPASIWLLASGSVAKGLVLIAGGTLVVGLVDNVLRPILVGYETKMPDYVVLLSTLGGLMVFGISGVVIGPLLAALFLVVWEMMAEEYAAPGQLASHPPDSAVQTVAPLRVPPLPDAEGAPNPSTPSRIREALPEHL